jgi:hypothetical protein
MQAIFILSTGRCGTQWIAAHLGQAYPELQVVHEPLRNEYHPRQMLGAKTPLALDPDIGDLILDHAAAIEQTIAGKRYLECGHPCWSTIPWFAGRFAGRVAVIHLVRHPVATAFSWLTHMAYQPPLESYIKEKVLLSPFDPGVQFTQYRELWPALSPFEKALYYWMEVNAFGLDQREALGVPWCTIRYEDLFHGAGLEQLLAFLELPAKDSLMASLDKSVDNYRYLTSVAPELRLVARHPEVVATAARFGYDALSFEDRSLQRRYTGRG